VELLILGGTLFLGRHLTAAALAQGHEVTLFNRGETNPDLFPEAEKLVGDRDGDLRALEGRSWDAAVDVPGRVPRLVRTSAEALAGSVEHFTFVSSISVYADFSQPGIDEDSPTRPLEEGASEDDMDTYGPRKAECERIVRELFPRRSLVVRPGLIVGPHDPTDRFTYWPRRIAVGGEVLAPGDPGRRVQVIDARDLAEWLVSMIELRVTGVFNATGPEYPLTMGRLLQECRAASRSDAGITWVEDRFLVDAGVGEWMELPLWLADPEWAGMLETDVSRALDAGLSFRPLRETIRDTLEWDSERAPEERAGDVGLAPERERELLESWRART
jgi:2'-hydroxyisoflavone reductase